MHRGVRDLCQALEQLTAGQSLRTQIEQVRLRRQQNGDAESQSVNHILRRVPSRGNSRALLPTNTEHQLELAVAVSRRRRGGDFFDVLKIVNGTPLLHRGVAVRMPAAHHVL